MHHFRFVSAAVSPFTQAFVRLSWPGSVLLELIMKTLNSRTAGLLTTSLLVAGVSALSPASVRAIGADTCGFGGYETTTVPSCQGFTFDQQFDKTLKLKAHPLTGLFGPTTGSGTIQFIEQTSGIWVVDVDFEQDLMANASGTFEYQLDIDPTFGMSFDEVGLAIIGPPIGMPMFKASKAIVSMTPSKLNVTENSKSATGTIGGEVKSITVIDTYEVSVGSINSLQNSFSQKPDQGDPERVPGPLPLLGAGAAFGFSRRLRTRVLAARGA
jgi:hypothetical protein